MRNEFILKKWNAAQGNVYVPLNNIDELMSKVPDGWWLLHTTTHLLFASLVHRMNPDVVLDPTVAPTGPTHDALCAEACHDTVKRREMERIVANHSRERQLSEDSMIKSKAQLMAQTIDSGLIDQVKEQLLL
jgi:hypothetical protein